MIPSWPISRLGEAIEALGRTHGTHRSPAVPKAPEIISVDMDLQKQWIETTAIWFGLEMESLDVAARDVEIVLSRCGPALLRLPDGNFIAQIDNGRVLAPDLSVHRAKPRDLASLLSRDLEIQFAPEIETLLNDAHIPPRRRARARDRILRECFRDQRISGCWSVRMPPGNSWSAARKAGLPGLLALLMGTHVVEYGLWIASWWLVGEGALQGQINSRLLAGWALLLLAQVPFRALTTWLEGVTAIVAGGLLKERLLAGVLRLDPEEVRHEGSGQMFGRVIESDAVESLALNGGFSALTAAIELAMAAMVLASGAGGVAHVLLLLLWIALTLSLAWRYFHSSRDWTSERLWMTHDLVERMVGHRTRLAQEIRERWHEDEDQTLERYLHSSRRVDADATWLAALIPTGWLCVSLLVLVPPFISGSGSVTGLAVGIGGMLLARQALQGFTIGLWNIAGATIAWKQVAPLFQAAARPLSPESPDIALGRKRQKSETLVEAQNLVFQYKIQTEPVLRGCNLRIAAGDHILLEGPSGGGKSAFGSILARLRRPNSGLLLADGRDHSSFSAEGWRRIVALAPQFHENYVLSGSFAFNLLLGRDGQLSERNLEEAESICDELGLRELITRMPGGILQMVGESGWQLSHGERSRLFIARALLQQAEVVILDESLSALDPANLKLALHCVANRASAALVIAHR